ncbi:uncharacterized protein [Hyperolius riggenbachi]|uniref:uncharacterized protein n=1 Tax=Hyperolius riggenbachi TaxID=752182 RepID=UPI0035A38874
MVLGKLPNVSRVVFSPSGEMYAVCRGDLYIGPMPTPDCMDWFSLSRRIGRGDWDTFKFLFFHPKGELYGVTKLGEFYKGPTPYNENISWLYRQAEKIGHAGWHKFEAFFFDPKGILYAVTDKGRLLKETPPTRPDYNWFLHCKTVRKKGWRVLTHFVSFDGDGNLWCVHRNNGNLYKGPPPSSDNVDYMTTAEMLGSGYNQYTFLSFALDQTIQTITRFEFLINSAKTLSENNEILERRVFENKGEAPLKHSFLFSKTMKDTSTFTPDSHFVAPPDSGICFDAGTPRIADDGFEVTIDEKRLRTWFFNKTNETEVTFSSNITVELESGTAVCVVAFVKKIEIDVPYRASINTLFGFEATIFGIWKGAGYSNLVVTQEDFTKCVGMEYLQLGRNDITWYLHQVNKPAPTDEVLESMKLKLLHLSAQETNMFWLLKTMKEYWEANMIPRNHRIVKDPRRYGRSRSFIEGWFALARKSSFKLMKLTMSYAEREHKKFIVDIRKLREKILKKYDLETLVDVAKHVEYQMIAFQEALKYRKRFEFQRTKEDYEMNRAFTYKLFKVPQRRKPFRRNLRKRAPLGSKNQPLSLSESDWESVDESFSAMTPKSPIKRKLSKVKRFSSNQTVLKSQHKIQ